MKHNSGRTIEEKEKKFLFKDLQSEGNLAAGFDDVFIYNQIRNFLFLSYTSCCGINSNNSSLFTKD